VSIQAPDSHGYIQGFAGLYNFGITSGSARLPSLWSDALIGLNYSQTGARLRSLSMSRLDRTLLADLLVDRRARLGTRIRGSDGSTPPTLTERRSPVYSHSLWHSSRCLASSRCRRPIGSSTRSPLLLGRTPRLDTWAGQFYDARSQVITRDMSRSASSLCRLERLKGEGPYQSLLSYAEKSSNSAIGSVLAGAELARVLDSRRSWTNEERLHSIRACL